jgi:hypothetical protein
MLTFLKELKNDVLRCASYKCGYFSHLSLTGVEMSPYNGWFL